MEYCDMVEEEGERDHNMLVGERIQWKTKKHGINKNIFFDILMVGIQAGKAAAIHLIQLWESILHL